MVDIIAPIPKEKIKTELNEDTFLRYTNFGSNEIYVLNGKNSPNTVLEIGRLREVTFRSAGGGTGKSVDLDEFDLSDTPYQQLIVWDPEAEHILGGYRYIHCIDTKGDDGDFNLATTELFNFSDTFKKEYLPYVLELGRSFVQPQYQSSKAGRKGLFALDNLWDGLGALIVNSPQTKFFYGKATMYTDYNQLARDYLLYFIDMYFGDRQGLITPKVPLGYFNPIEMLKKEFTGKSYKENYKILSRQVRNLKENIPPLINSYMNLSPTMKSFGTAINQGFGGVEETGILVKIDDIYPEKKQRHIESYLSQKTK